MRQRIRAETRDFTTDDRKRPGASSGRESEGVAGILAVDAGAERHKW